MPQRRHVARGGFTAAAATACLALATPAWASATIPLNPAHKGSTAAGFGEQQCNDGRFAGKAGNQDGWHFVLPGKDGGNFESLSLTFTNGTTQVKVQIPDSSDAYPDFFYSAGGRIIHAYLFTPAGWTLADGSAVISGKGSKFNLSHTCAGKVGEESPSPSPSTPGEESPTPSPSTPGEESPTPSPSTPGEETPTPGEESPTPCEETSTPTTPGEETSTPCESPTPGESGGSDTPSPSSSVGGGAGGGNNGGGLPVTGVAATSIALTGIALIGGGVALTVLRRRRDKITFTS
ncbi:hypothetical protein ABZ570_23770 [Micromonospora sp. NPDC007271]|uniref:hypothetical protein n=1 Tax=Micromonospora sp. NPDC007271 TaxID=3154587 RepID=UPI00340C6757